MVAEIIYHGLLAWNRHVIALAMLHYCRIKHSVILGADGEFGFFDRIRPILGRDNRGVANYKHLLGYSGADFPSKCSAASR